MTFRQSSLIAAFLLVLLCLLSGCGNAKLFKIAPKTQVQPDKLCCQVTTADVLIAAEPLLDEDKILATFDGNIILSGVLPVNILVENRSSSPIDLKHAQFVIVDSKGKQHKELDSKHTLDKMVRFYGINYRRKGSYEATLADLNAIGLADQSTLGAGDRTQGFLYFDFDQDQSTQGLKLLVKRLPATNSKTAIEIDLSHKS
jgi:hypothetical protein